MQRFHAGRWSARSLSWGTQGSTHFARLSPNSPTPGARPVIKLHGYNTGNWEATIQIVLDGGTTTGMPFDALLDTGRTIYIPYTGNCFGRRFADMVNTTELVSSGGTGLDAIDAMRTQAAADGLNATTVDLIGGSMGVCNAVNWACDNPTLVHRIYGFVPAIEFDTLYAFGPGFPSIQQSLLYAYGGANKAAFMAASAGRDLIRRDISSVADRISIVASDPDALIRYAGVVSWTTTWGIPLVTTAANHFSLDDPNFAELDVLSWLA